MSSLAILLATCASALLTLGSAVIGTAHAVQDSKPVLQIYDVSDLLQPRRDFPAPRLGLDGLDPNSEGRLDTPDESPTAFMTRERLIELIRRVVGIEEGIAADSLWRSRGVLAVSAPREAHERLVRELTSLRAAAGRAYQIEAKLIACDDAALRQLGFRPGSKRLARLISREASASFAKARRADVRTAPRMTTLAGQRSHLLVANQEAYVADLKKGEKGVVDPTVEVFSEGIVLEVKARPRGRGRTLLGWHATVSHAPRPFAVGEIEGGSISLPEVRTTTVEGRSVLSGGKVLAIRGLPDPDGVEDAQCVLLLTCTEISLATGEDL